MRCLIALACCVLVAQAYTLKDAKDDESSVDLSDPRVEIKMLAEAAGLSKSEVMDLIEDPPSIPSSTEQEILALAAKIMEMDIGGSSRKGKKGGKGSGGGSGGSSGGLSGAKGSGGKSRGPKPTGSGADSMGPKPTESGGDSMGPQPTDGGASLARREMDGLKGGKRSGGSGEKEEGASPSPKASGEKEEGASPPPPKDSGEKSGKFKSLVNKLALLYYQGGKKGGKKGGEGSGGSGEKEEGASSPPKASGEDASFERRKMKPAEGQEAEDSVKGEGKKGGKKGGKGKSSDSDSDSDSSGEEKGPRPTGSGEEKGPRPTGSGEEKRPAPTDSSGNEIDPPSGAASVEEEDRLVRELSVLLRRIARTM